MRKITAQVITSKIGKSDARANHSDDDHDYEYLARCLHHFWQNFGMLVGMTGAATTATVAATAVTAKRKKQVRVANQSRSIFSQCNGLQI